MIDVKVQNNSTVLVDTAATQLLIQTRIDFPERDRTRGNKPFAIICACWRGFREVDGNACSEAEGMADESPACFDAVGSFHAVFNNKHGAADRQTRSRVINPRLDATRTSNNIIFHECRSECLVLEKTRRSGG